MRQIIWGGVLVFAVSGSLHAAGPHGGQPVLGGIVQQQDIELFFDYLRDAVTAAAEGRPAEPPQALARRAQEIGEEMKRHGAAAARALIDALESELREAPREPPRPLGAPAYQRI
jgi:hypothetical protein